MANNIPLGIGQIRRVKFYETDPIGGPRYMIVSICGEWVDIRVIGGTRHNQLDRWDTYLVEKDLYVCG